MAKYVSDGIEEASALEKTYKVITKLAPQVPLTYRGGAHKVELLRKAVVGYDWAIEPLSRIATHKLTFQGLYSELETALNLSKDGQLPKLGDQVSIKRERSKVIAGIMY